MWYYEAKLSSEDYWNICGDVADRCAAAESFADNYELGPEPDEGYLIDVRSVFGRGDYGAVETFNVVSWVVRRHTAVLHSPA